MGRGFIEETRRKNLMRLIIFAPVGNLVPKALQNVDKGGTLFAAAFT
jgi:hypothetical protein